MKDKTMNPTIATERVRSGKRYAWKATGTESLYCLFRCSHCHKVNLMRTNASVSVQERHEEDALNELARIRPEIMEKLRTPGPKEGELFLRVKLDCRCAFCADPQIWNNAVRKGKKSDGRAGCLTVVLLSVVMLCITLLMITLRVSKQFGLLLLNGSMIVLFVGSEVLYGLWRGRAWKRVCEEIEEGTRDDPPLFGDSIEAVCQQAQQCSSYRGITPSEMYSLAKKEIVT